jgi:ABC-2 type transport system permease protein
MSAFSAALWAESLKARRSKVPWLTALGFAMAPLVGGLFMIILKDPERARSWGLISTKAQLAAGVADWPTFFSLLTYTIAVAGALLFALVTAWIFGREFSDHTTKELLALPTSREAIVSSKFVVLTLWALAMMLFVFGLHLVVGMVVGLPGWSRPLLWGAAGDLLATTCLTLALMSPVALLASAGRGYLPPLGWAFLTLALAQIVVVIGWGAWFPWAVPALFSGMAGPRSGQIGWYSYVVVAVVCAAGLLGTYLWWRKADQTR